MEDVPYEWSEELAKATKGIGHDYDYGADSKEGKFGHYTDKGKLPWHHTFSNESIYATKQHPGGTWSWDAPQSIGGHATDVYTPSTQMIRDGRANGLAAYISRINRYHEDRGDKGQYTGLAYPVPYKTPEYYKRP